MSLILAACTSAHESTLDVDVVTDLVPGPEFNRVVVDLLVVDGEAQRQAVHAEAFVHFGMAFARGARVASFPSAPSGDLIVRVRAIAPSGSLLVEQRSQIRFSKSRTLKVFLDRECVAVECPSPSGSAAFTACLGGQCVDPRCEPSDPSTYEFCPETTFCNAATDCAAVPACAEQTCVSGICIVALKSEENGGCGDSLYCDLEATESACLPVPTTTRFNDAGTNCGTICHVAGNPCVVGYWDCSDAGEAVCTDLVNVPAGTPCGVGLVCDEAQSCISSSELDAGMDAASNASADSSVRDSGRDGGGIRCGNGVVESGEVCDDNNTIDTDDCSSNCRARTCYATDVPTLTSTMATASCRRIEVAAGTYAGHFTLNHPATVVGAGHAVTIIDGQSTGRPISVSTTSTVTFSRMTIANGYALGNSGCFEANAPLILDDVEVHDCVAEGGVGGALNTNKSLEIRNSLFHDNQAMRGGAVWISSASSLSLNNVMFQDNVASSMVPTDVPSAGALDVTDVATVRIMSSTFTDNRVDSAGDGFGGAVEFQSCPDVVITGSAFSGNRLNAPATGTYRGGYGGAFNTWNSNVQVATSSFNGNSVIASRMTPTTSAAIGGAIMFGANTSTYALTLQTCQFGTNTVDAEQAEGGAIYATAQVTIQDSTFASNDAIGESTIGGALRVINSTATIERSLFLSNESTSTASQAYGGGIGADGSTLSILDTIIHQNKATIDRSMSSSPRLAGGGVYNEGGALSIWRSHIRENTLDSIAPAMSQSVLGAGVASFAQALDSTFYLRDSAVRGNSIHITSPTQSHYTSGAGVALTASDDQRMPSSIISSTIGENTVTGDTSQSTIAGIQLFGYAQSTSSLTLSVSNATLVGRNSASADGRMVHFAKDVSGTAAITYANTIVDDLSNDEDSCAYEAGVSVSSHGYNLIAYSCFSGMDATNYLMEDGSMLESASLNSIETADENSSSYYSPYGTSPAINGGNPAGCSDFEGNLIITDQLGNPRVGTCDIGAVEVIP